MELKLHASMASIPHAIFTHSSSFVPFCTYATPNISRRRNGNTNRRSTHKIPSLRKEKYPNEQKLMLNHQNQNPLNVDLVALREEGNLDQVLELMGQGCDGLLVFQQMKQAWVPLDGETFELVLTACA
ncbi:hypothetical protein JHK86_001523 [Glycine max]|nr:hypothetical protein JHK86_001523 [Glycine max]